MLEDISRLKYLIILCIVVTGFAQTGSRYLVITPDYFFPAVRPLVEWKYKKGLRPAVYKTSQIGSDTASIKNFIKNCYDNWDIKPEFLLLVGHPGYIPMHYYQYTSFHYYTDNYYSNMDGDLYNEILPGRISVNDSFQLKTVIAKIFAYERYPSLADTLWFTQGCAIANCDGEDDSIYLHCMRYAESLSTENGFSNVDTFCDYYGHNSSHIISSINNGRIFVMYRGNANNHWYTPFDVSPYSTNNGVKLPIIMSTTCRTVSPTSSPILGENFLRVGSPSSVRGAVGFYGGTRNTGNAAHLRNAVAIGFLDALFLDRVRTFGEAAEGGRKRVYQQWGELREYNNFTCLGDPEMTVWTAVPCSLDVEHPDFVTQMSAHFAVRVRDMNTGTPVSHAHVCVAGRLDSSVYVVDTTDANGEVIIDIEPQIIDDTVYVTVTGRNIQPYEGHMVVKLLNYCYIIYQKSSIRDSLSGNNDGYINPTEQIALPLWVENIGESTGVDITGILSNNSAYITITDSIHVFGEIPGRDSSYAGLDGYNFLVSYDCPDSHSIDFELKCYDTNDSCWISSFREFVLAPMINYRSTSIDGGNGDNIIDPGETLSVIVELGNSGSIAADSVGANLKCSIYEIRVLDSLGVFGHIGADSVKTNESDPFEVFIDPFIPIGTVVNFLLEVSTNYGAEKFMFTLVIGQKNYYVWNPDPLPGSGERIHTLLSGMGYYGDYGTDYPTHDELYQALLICLGVYSDRHIIVENSGEAQAITNFLLNGGRVYMEGSSVWHVDPEYFAGHDFGNLFGLQGLGWSYGDMGPLDGQSGTFTTGMHFDYTGENRYMDHISAIGSGFNIFRDSDNNYYSGVASAAGDYRTVGISFELGYLNDDVAPSTRTVLLDSIMKFFGIPGPGISEDEQVDTKIKQPMFSAINPVPFTSHLSIQCRIPEHGGDNIALKIYDITGRHIKDLSAALLDCAGNVTVKWNGEDDNGRQVAEGVYFVRFTGSNSQQVRKTIFIR